MTKEEVISKVRKLFELSGSPNENEAALAAAKARELLARHNLSMADLSTDELKSAIAATEASVKVGKVLRNWEKGLLIHIARGFECEHIIRRRQGCSPLLTFIGTEADAEVASYTFQFLYRELNRLVDRTLPRLKRENRNWNTASLRYAYLDGAVKRIGERFRERTQAVRTAESNGCRELVLVKDEIIRNYMASAFSSIKTEYSRSRIVSAGAFEKGYKDADHISLRAAVSGNSEEYSQASLSDS
ncbi:MAG: DUF2786 domain-containing protein [Desulfomonile tiedjei]|uniref:DUF2786 domain-containing protein n=1 Tax=Desulfomonile tiedjei TaxID=2358 RepID=A0A9D6V6E9_9BACT|nr:DUF2786 domain-containing protein [Desulfomonile tiedjei]